MKILLLCNKSPYPTFEGGPMAMNSIITGLLEAGHQVKILAVNSKKYNVTMDDIPEDYRKKTGIELIDVDLRVKPVQALKNLFSTKSYHVERFISKDFTNRLVEVLKEDIYDVVQLETLFMAPYVDTIRKYTKALIVLRAHNVEHLIWERIAKGTRFFLKRMYINHLAKTLKNYELNAINQVDGIAAITRKDAAFFRKYCATPTIDIPYGVYPEEFHPNYEVQEQPQFYHIGSMNWMPNEEGIRWFVDDCLDSVVAKVPDFVFHLAGRNMPEWLKEMKNPHVDVIGEVPDAKEFVANHDVAIVPLLSGSGIRIKIIESMALGKTVITTQVGAEGILYEEDVNIIIAENKAKMAEAIRRINENPAMAERIGRAARKLVEDVYDNRKLTERLLLFYQQIKPSSKITFV
ncbi:MAG: glycosyltransferase family 4 protein [Bacteroidales bacterium]|nr:glycosyltransferase family 4 protein [Bacteroidales bacterium]